jgi:hypothetical protein
MRTFLNILTLGIYGLRRANRLASIRTVRRRRQTERALRLRADRARFAGYPEIEISRAEYEQLLAARGQGLDLNECPIGTRFLYKPQKAAPELVLLGEIVSWQNAIASQVGAALFSMPARFANCYRVKVAA